MKHIPASAFVFVASSWAAVAGAQSAAAPTVNQEPESTHSKPRGFIGGLLGAGFAASEFETDRKAHVDASLLFALRGGLLVGAGHRGVVAFEFAPVTNKIDWSFGATTTFLASFGMLRAIGNAGNWSWLWKVGVGGGLDYRCSTRVTTRDTFVTRAVTFHRSHILGAVATLA